MISGDGFAKILDYGLANLTDTGNEFHKLQQHQSSSGVILGTLGHRSSEQALDIACKIGNKTGVIMILSNIFGCKVIPGEYEYAEKA